MGRIFAQAVDVIEYTATTNIDYSTSYLLNYGRDVKMPQLSPLINEWAVKNKVFLFDFDNWYFRSDITTGFLHDYVHEIVKTHDYVLVCEQHPFSTIDEKYILRHRQIVEVVMPVIKTMFATSDWNNWNKNRVSNYTFLPTWYFEQRNFAKNHNYNKVTFSNDRPYVFSCVNKANLRPEKLYNYIKCYQQRTSDWFLTAYQVPDLPAEVLGCNNDQNKLWQEEIRPGLKQFDQDLENFIGKNVTAAQDEVTTVAFSMLFPGYTQAHVNLAIEHSMEFPIMSEKTFKPFAAGQLPIFLGYPGIAGAVRTLGFDIFDDIIPHDSYDNVTFNVNTDQVWQFWSNRVDAVHQLIDTLNLTEFKKQIISPAIRDRRNKNKLHFYRTAIDTMCIQWLDHLLTVVKANNIFTDMR